jgi:hypothetical protein
MLPQPKCGPCLRVETKGTSVAEPSSTITAWAVFSAIGGSIVGSVLGGCISYFLQRKNLAAAKEQREADRYEVRKSLAYALFFKMIRIHSTIALLDRDNSATLTKMKTEHFTGALWQRMLGHGNLPPTVKFTTDEMALLLSLDPQLFNELGPYDDVHNSLLDLFALYAQQRHAMMEKFGAKMNGAIGTTELTKEDAEWFAPRAYSLNELAKTMVQRTEHDSKESRALLQKLHALFVKSFGLNPKLEFKEFSELGADEQKPENA